MPTNDEKVAFAKRLELALRRTSEPVAGATELALRFNLRHEGSAVSAQTAHKWLSGRAIPTSDKLDTLAEWLNVDKHWLHYGPPPKGSEGAKQKTAPEGAVEEVLLLAKKIQALPPHRRYLVEELINQLQDDI
jgi:transcriptional regulator with XRE-family HTH domain